MRRQLFFVLPLFALAACTPGEDAPTEDAAAGGEDTAAVMEDAVLDLQATGIVVPEQNGFEELAAPFGSNRAATEATLGNILGEVIGTYEGGGDCWLKLTDYRGVQLAFNDEDEFVGYYAEEPYVPELSRAEMLSDPAVELFEESTLGEEFTIGDGEAVISGIFSGEEDTAIVESLWAGETCVFR